MRSRLSARLEALEQKTALLLVVAHRNLIYSCGIPVDMMGNSTKRVLWCIGGKIGIPPSPMFDISLRP